MKWWKSEFPSPLNYVYEDVLLQWACRSWCSFACRVRFTCKFWVKAQEAAEMPLVCPHWGPSKPCSWLLNSPICTFAQAYRRTHTVQTCIVQGSRAPLFFPDHCDTISAGMLGERGWAWETCLAWAGPNDIKSFLRFAGDINRRTVVYTLSYWNGMTESAVCFPQGWGQLCSQWLWRPLQRELHVALWSLCCTWCVAVCFFSVQPAWPPVVRDPFSFPVYSQWLL